MRATIVAIIAAVALVSPGESRAQNDWQYPDPYLNGRIAQFSAYSRVLSAEEISQNYNALRGRFGL